MTLHNFTITNINGADILDTINPSLVGLFSAAFLSATLLPGGSELILVYLVTQNEYSALLLLAVASIGNTLGGMTNWILGFALKKGYRWRRKTETPESRALIQMRKYGSPALLLSWLPIIGDPLCFAAGWLRIHWLSALLFIAIGKTIRYGLVIAAT